MTRVGFVPPSGDQGWLGGISYFRNLFRALEHSRSGLLKPVVFIGGDADAQLFADYPAVELVRSALVSRGSGRWWLRQLELRLAHRDHLLCELLRKREIGVLSHSGHLGPGADIPALGWIPDLQHLKLREFFTLAEIAARTKLFRAYCRYCPLVIVSSLAAAGDLRSAEVQCADKIRCLPFVADVPAPAELPPRAELERKYHLPGAYVLLPAQFWAHKNHIVVVEALTYLKGKGDSILVLATGNPRDYRQPEHFAQLMTRVRSAGVEAEFRALGVIPHRDVMGLMLNAAAVVNPSLFEGWSTTVEEAKSLGKRVILSDIAVHREQAPSRGLYFEPRDAEALARHLLSAVRDLDPTEEQNHESQARSELPNRQAEYARKFEEIVVEGLTIGEQRRSSVRPKAA